MPGIDIHQSVAKPSISVRLSQSQLQSRQKRAVLLSSSGVQLRIFPLLNELNELPLDDIATGVYSIRVETGDEVMVRQIMVP